jgi:cell division protein FtsN
MNKNGNSRGGPAAPRKGSSLVAAVLVGMVLGLAVAAGVAWYILKSPSPFVNATSPREPSKLTPDPVKPPPVKVVQAVASEVQAASAAQDSKPRFEFYKVLTDKPDTPLPVQPTAKSAEKPAKSETYFLQAGAFASAEDADKLKAKLAMLGIEASVQSATLPDKTVWHRVRLGPYKNADEMNKASAMLKQNGVSATPMRAQ